MLRTTLTIILIYSLTACSTANKNTQPKLDGTDKEQDGPTLNSPVTKKIWIPDKLDSSGTKLEKGHWLYLIERQSTWSN